MAFEQQKQDARSILSGLEDGTSNAKRIFDLVREADPTLVYFLFAWLRAHYPSTHPSGDGVLGRLAELCTEHPRAARMARDGEADSIVAWFEEGHSYHDYTGPEFIELIVDKLEG